MRPPCELVQREYLPEVRAQLSRVLNGRGLSQTEIAEKIGTTQAAVSKYLRHRTQPSPLLPFIMPLTERLADSILDGSSTSSVLVKQVCSVCMSLRIGSEICTRHRENVSSLGKENCIICTELLGGMDHSLSAKSKVLLDIQAAMTIIQSSANFASLVPQVRANLVASAEGATTVSEVAGIPGRITLVEGVARAVVGPRFGASTHTAELLLKIQSKWPQYRSCLCLSGRDEVIEVARLQDVRIDRLSCSESDPNEIARSAMRGQPKRVSGILGIHVPGGVGVEPILYIFGKSAQELGTLSSRMGALLD